MHSLKNALYNIITYLLISKSSAINKVKTLKDNFHEGFYEHPLKVKIATKRQLKTKTSFHLKRKMRAVVKLFS